MTKPYKIFFITFLFIYICFWIFAYMKFHWMAYVILFFAWPFQILLVISHIIALIGLIGLIYEIGAFLNSRYSTSTKKS